MRIYGVSKAVDYIATCRTHISRSNPVTQEVHTAVYQNTCISGHSCCKYMYGIGLMNHTPASSGMCILESIYEPIVSSYYVLLMYMCSTITTHMWKESLTSLSNIIPGTIIVRMHGAIHWGLVHETNVPYLGIL